MRRLCYSYRPSNGPRSLQRLPPRPRRNRTLQLLLLAQQDAATAGHCRTLSLQLPAQQDAAAAAASVIGRYNYCVTGRCNCQRWWMLRSLQLLLLTLQDCNYLMLLDAATTAAAGATERLQLIMLLDHIT